ncbi:hypothetical protein D9M68_871610 [compost metagenome]
MFHQVAHQRFADAGTAALRIHGQAPEAGAAFRVIEGLVMVEAHHGTDHLAIALVFGQPILRPALVARGDGLLIHWQHTAAAVELIDCQPVAITQGAADAEAAKGPTCRAVVGEPEPQGVGWVEEELLWRLGQHLLGRRDVEGDIALAGAFGK